ncbi:MAG TPA: membrane protein insertase YidC [Nocardioidaceae bacterium]|nr:membrane protein insertase YidC [Nocardioidaceae bacterium]
MIDFFQQLGSWIMTPLYYVTSFIMTSFHTAFSALFGEGHAAQGWAWALSIIGLTIVIRIILIPLFVKQIKSSRNMQLLQPKVKALQKKYGHDRERLAQETMALYKETGTNPFASCLPIVMQMPIFFALFRLINAASSENYTQHGVLTQAQAEQLQNATLFGAKISEQLLDASTVSTYVLAISLVLAMTATTFLTQKQLMSKNMPADAMTGQYAQTQKLMLYVLPVAFAVGGVAFPIGVLLYWSTSNLWTMGQQFYVIRNNPAPGTPAAQAKAERDAKKGKGPLAVSGAGTETETEQPPAPPQRNQPKKQPRSQRQQPGGKPAPSQRNSQAGKNNQPKNTGQPKRKPRPDITKPTDRGRSGS